MPVVTARVHDARGLGGGHAAIATLEHGQRIHVGPQHQRRSRPAAVEVGDDPGATDAGADGEAEVAAPPCEHRRGVVFLLGQLGVAVQRAPGFDDRLASAVDLGAEASLEVGGDAAHDRPERRNATTWRVPLLITRVAPEASARLRTSRSS